MTARAQRIHSTTRRRSRRVPKHPDYTICEGGEVTYHGRRGSAPRTLRPVRDAEGDFVFCLDGRRYRQRDILAHAFRRAPLTAEHEVRFNSRHRPDTRVRHLLWTLPSGTPAPAH